MRGERRQPVDTEDKRWVWLLGTVVQFHVFCEVAYYELLTSDLLYQSLELVVSLTQDIRLIPQGP